MTAVKTYVPVELVCAAEGSVNKIKKTLMADEVPRILGIPQRSNIFIPDLAPEHSLEPLNTLAEKQAKQLVYIVFVLIAEKLELIFVQHLGNAKPHHNVFARRLEMLAKEQVLARRQEEIRFLKSRIKDDPAHDDLPQQRYMS